MATVCQCDATSMVGGRCLGEAKLNQTALLKGALGLNRAPMKFDVGDFQKKRYP